MTPHTLVERAELDTDVALTRERGYVVSDEDVTVGVFSRGVPVFVDGRLFGGLSLGGLKVNMRARQEELLERLRAAAATFSGTSSFENAG